MKRRIAFLLALVMCFGLVFSALPAANAMVMDFIWDQPCQTAPERKVSFSVLEKMAAAEDDELISVCVHLRRLSREEIEALVPMTKPSNYVNESTQEERDAWSHLEYQTRQRIYSGMSRAFIQRYLDETEAPESLPIQETPHFNCALNKSRIAALAALDEVIWINDAWMNIYLVQEPAPQEKLTGSLLAYLQTAQEDERIPVRIWLRGFRTEEYEAMNPIPYPTFSSTMEEIQAYLSANSQAAREMSNDLLGTFIRTRLDDGDEVLYRPTMYGIPVIVVKTSAARIASLAALRIVTQIDPAFGYDEAFPDPELPANAAERNKIDDRLQEFMTIATHDELIPLYINLNTPATINADSTREEKRAAYSVLTTDFVQNQLDENDEVYVRSNYSTLVVASVPKYKIAQLAALEEVREIRWGLGHDDLAYPADGGDAVFQSAENAEPLDPAVLAKISPYLLGWMNAVPDDEIIPIGLWLKAPSAEQIGISTPVGTIDSYISAKRQAMREVISGITTAFVQDHLDESDEIIMRGNYIPNIWVKVPKSKIAVLAALDAVTSVDYVGFDGQELIPTEADVSEKYSQSLKEFLEIAEDGERIPIAIRLKTLTEAEIDELVALPRPGLDSSGEEIDAYNAQRRDVLKQYYSAQTNAFADAYLDGGDEIISRSNSLPTIWVSVPKNKVKILAALDEVTSISLVDGYDAELLPTEPADPDDPEVLKKLDPYLLEQMEKAPDNAKIPIDVTLATPSEEEILAQIDVPVPGAGATLEEVNAYNSAMRRAKRAVYSAITSAFAEDHLDENDTVRFRGNYIPTLIIEVPKPKVLSLAALEEVTHVGWADGYTILYPMDPATPDPPEEPGYTNKLDPYLIEQMEKEPDDAFIPISILLEGPSQEKIKAMLPIPEPDIHSNVTLEEVEAYISAKRELSRELYSAITNAFVQEHLDENDTIRFCGRYIPSVTVEVPKQKVYTLAALENVTSISWADRNTSVYPTVPLWPNLPAEYEKKITQALKDYATPLPDDTDIPVRFDLRDPDESLIERMVSATVPKPGEDASQEEIDAYNAAYREKWREQISVRTGAFVNYRLEETETVYYIGEDTAVVICEVPKSRIAYLASMDEVLQIDLAGSYLDPLPCEHDYQAVVTAPTCTEGGYTTYTCSKCSDSYTGSETAALGHSYRTAVTPPTCTEPGFTTYTCSKCGDSYRGDETEALGHSYRTVVTPPTCTEPGFTTHTCTRCGDSYTDAETAALGHSFGQWRTTREAACTAGGEQTRACVRCDEKETRYTDALGHDYQDGVCTRCGAADPGYTPPPSEPEPDPAHGQLSSELIDYLEDKPDDYWVVISFDIKVPSMDQIVADAGLVKPDDGASVEAHSAYYETEWTKRSIAYANAKLAFYDAHLVQFKSQAMRSEYFNPTLWIQTQKSGVDAFVGLEEITSEIGLGLDWQSPAYDEIFASEAPDSPLRRKLSAELYLYMQGKPDDVLIPIHFHLRGLSKAEILARAQLTEPEAGAPYAEVQAYGEALSAAWKEANAEISEIFVREHLDERSNVVLSGLEMIVEVPKSQIAGLAALSEITSVIDLDLYREPYAYPADPGEPEEPVNYDTLKAVIAEAEKLNLNDYTSETAEALSAALADAKQALDSESQQAVDAAAAALMRAIAPLVATPTSDPEVLKKLSSYLIEYMADKQDGEGIPIAVWLKSPSDAEMEAMIPVEYPGLDATLEEVNAYLTAKRKTVAAVITPITDAFVQDHLDENDEIIFQSHMVPTVWAVVPKAKVLSLAALDEVLDIGYYENNASAAVPTITVADKVALLREIEEPLPPMQFTVETSAVYHEAWQKADAVYQNTYATQEEVDAAAEELRNARTALKAPVYDALNAAIAGAEAIDRSKYSDNLLAALDQALIAARSVRSDSLSQTELDAAAQALIDAVEALVFYPPEPVRLDDVTDEEQYFYVPVYWALENGITTGTTPTTFSPNKGCTRAQVVTFLWRAAGEPEPEKTDNPFADVKPDAYYCKAVLWAVEQGITKGTSADKFSPDSTCTRAQIVTFLYRAAGSPAVPEMESPFKDVADGQYYTDAVIWAVGNEITTGKSADTFAPDATCTRGEVVTFLYRAKA